ncbi:hypothetical protein SteCoe_12466 [Stentor coeruleus]|uniref:DNA polymerase delta subunit OB-fold domain-containing protein n=1 Tax=Stentor coeruleus TaxID=5963 RepID=A0A1R2CAS7_9CILI|nr:hypothetical protein SteCoe_12466 [Stentor coeruleus]
MKGGRMREISFSYKFIGQRFIQDLHFTNQYFNIYRNRLIRLREHIDILDNTTILAERITDVKLGQHVYITGIIVRSHKLRASNIEKYIVKVGTMDLKPALGNYSTNEDHLFIEDENGRLKIDSQFLEGDWNELVTGIVVGIRGVIKEDAILQALDMVFPTAKLPRQIIQRADEYICFVSGLEIGNPTFPNTLYHVFIDYFLGSIESFEDPISGKIVRLIILGDSIYKPLNARTVDRKAVGENEVKGFQEMNSSLKQLDTILAELSGIFPVDIIPGEMDPTNASFPQQPLSPYLFFKASVYSALQSVPNPYEFELDGVSILCTSGQNINSMAQFLPESLSELEIMDLTLKYKHIIPTAPDALQCIPLQDSDPFILNQLPNLYIAGNMKTFRTGITNDGVRIVTVPKFENSKTFVVMNRFTLES